MTILILIFSEILPKTYAFRNANGAALLVARPVSFLVSVLSPFTHAIEAVVRLTLRLLGAGAAARDRPEHGRAPRRDRPAHRR